MRPRELARAADRVVRTYGVRRQREAEARTTEQRRVERAARKAELAAAKERLAAQRQRRRAEAEAARLARAEAATSACAHYLQVRSWARRMADGHGRESLALTSAEQQVLVALRPLWDATPDMLANLRRWCQPISGVCTADYEDSSSDLAKRIRRDVKRLFMEVGHELFVPEPDVLGGFGYETDRGRCNADTLTFFNTLVGLQDGAVLGGIRETGRRLVWEPGGGWGGFAYQLKTVCPNVTCLITGLPAMLLVSAVYLAAVWPNARCRFYDSSRDDIWQGWADVDFIFAPETAVPSLRPPQLDVTIDVLSLRGMSPERVHAHVQMAFESGCRFFYSLHRGSSSDGDVPFVWKAIERFYWLQPVAPRIEVTKAVPEYSHVVGWKRLRV